VGWNSDEGMLEDDGEITRVDLLEKDSIENEFVDSLEDSF
jgi:hypothetical protein